MEDLDRHDPAELLLRRAVDRPHRAGADEAQNLEPRVVEQLRRDFRGRTFVGRSGRGAGGEDEARSRSERSHQTDAGREGVFGELFQEPAAGGAAGDVPLDGLAVAAGERPGVERGELVAVRVVGVGGHG